MYDLRMVSEMSRSASAGSAPAASLKHRYSLALVNCARGIRGVYPRGLIEASGSVATVHPQT